MAHTEPFLMVVESDPNLIQRLVGDLERAYGTRYRVLGKTSPSRAREKLRQLRLDEERVALVLADLAETHLLTEAQQLFPDVKRIRLCAPTQVEEARDALRRRQADDFLVKPCQPPEKNLYPTLDDLLSDWDRHRSAAPQVLRVVGYRFSPESHQARDFLARNCVPFEWLDVERDEEARQILGEAGVTASELPLVLFPDGTRLARPSNAEIAERIGLRVHPKKPFYDLVIVGGPAGLAAAVYGASDGLRVVLIEGEAAGGQASLSSMIENYLGFPAGLTGADLARRAVAQARKFDAEIVAPQRATRVGVEGSSRITELADGSTLRSHAVLFASGVEW